MKTALLVLVLAILVATGAMAVTNATATMQLYPMRNQIASPVVPFDPYQYYWDKKNETI